MGEMAARLVTVLDRIDRHSNQSNLGRKRVISVYKSQVTLCLRAVRAGTRRQELMQSNLGVEPPTMGWVF